MNYGICIKFPSGGTKYRTICQGNVLREHKAKYLFFDLKEISHTNTYCFYIALPLTGRNPARRRAAGGGLPSCWVAICWRKGSVKEASVGVAALLQ